MASSGSPFAESAASRLSASKKLSCPITCLQESCCQTANSHRSVERAIFRGAPKRIPYSEKQFAKDLKRVRSLHDNLGREKSDVHKYWEAVYRLRRKWRRLKNNDGVDVAKIAKNQIGNLPISSGDQLLRFILDQTMVTESKDQSERDKLSKRKSKYFTLLNNAYQNKVVTKDLLVIVRRAGGLNASPVSLKKVNEKLKKEQLQPSKSRIVD